MLALFAEGIAGRPYHVKSVRELPDGGGDGWSPGGEAASHDGRSLYLPDAIAHFDDAGLNSAIYRLTVLDQLGFGEFGTYRFDIETARRRLPALAGRMPDAGSRESDLGVFFHGFAQPAIARAMFRILETARVREAVGRRYPGTRKYRRALRAHRQRAYPPAATGGVHDELVRLQAALEGVQGADSELLPVATAVLAPDADVYDSAAATAACLYILDPAPAAAADDVPADQGPAMEWLQREARLTDWDEELAKLEGDIAMLDFSEQAGDEVRVGDGRQTDGGELREVGIDLVAERDRLTRRIDMERSSVRRARGENRAAAMSCRYGELDYHNGIYLRGWCRLYEEPLLSSEDADSQALLDAVRPFAKSVRRRFEQVRPGGYQRMKKTPDGDEIDLDAIVETRADIRTGVSPDERVYSRRERLRRDVAAAFLVDLSASTDDIVPDATASDATATQSPRDFANAKSPSEEVAAQDVRDPFFDEDEEYDFAARMAEEALKRRIIDIQRESVLLMATALEGLGDRYGIYGFSGYGRDCVEFYVAKEFDQPFGQGVIDAIAAMRPKRSTRMGPAIRHAAAKLEASGAALRVLLIVSDGFPQDHDYGPHRGEHEYGVQDTAKSLSEAEARGIETFCVTVDRSGHDYLRRMCPDHRYMVIEETSELPDALQKAYRQLTRI